MSDTSHPLVRPKTGRKGKQAKTDPWNDSLVSLAVRFAGDRKANWFSIVRTRDGRRLIKLAREAGEPVRERGGILNRQEIRAAVWFLQNGQLTHEGRRNGLSRVLLSIEYETRLDMAVAFEAGRVIGTADILKEQEQAGNGGRGVSAPA